jgi:hypothetical protein
MEEALRDVELIVSAWLDSCDEPAQLAGLVRSTFGTPEIRRVLERGNDTAPCFVLRSAHRIASDLSQRPETMLGRLWNLLNAADRSGAFHFSDNRLAVWWRCGVMGPVATFRRPVDGFCAILDAARYLDGKLRIRLAGGDLWIDGPPSEGIHR